jgi:hypothetical protein
VAQSTDTFLFIGCAAAHFAGGLTEMCISLAGTGGRGH